MRRVQRHGDDEDSLERRVSKAAACTDAGKAPRAAMVCKTVSGKRLTTRRLEVGVAVRVDMVKEKGGKGQGKGGEEGEEGEEEGWCVSLEQTMQGGKQPLAFVGALVKRNRCCRSVRKSPLSPRVLEYKLRYSCFPPVIQNTLSRYSPVIGNISTTKKGYSNQSRI